jgi:hypothetical protein
VDIEDDKCRFWTRQPMAKPLLAGDARADERESSWMLDARGVDGSPDSKTAIGIAALAGRLGARLGSLDRRRKDAAMSTEFSAIDAWMAWAP